MDPITTDRRLYQALPWLGLVLLICFLLYLLSDVLMPFALGAVLAYLCDPLVVAMNKRGIKRAWGSLICICLLGLSAAFLALLVAPLIWREAALLAERLPYVIDVIQERVLPWASATFGVSLQLDADTLRTWAAEHWSKAGSVVGTFLSRATTSGGAAVSMLLGLLLVPIVMFYLLADWPQLMRRIEELIPRPWHDAAMRMLREMDAVLAEFVRGQLLVMLLLAAYYSAALWIAGVSFPLPVGILTGLLIFIPYVGYALGLLLALLVAALQFEGWSPIIGVAVVYSLGQLVESFILTPYLVGERIGLHPLAVIFLIMAFGQLFGFTGVLVALPVCAAGMVALREVRRRYFASALYRGEPA